MQSHQQRQDAGEQEVAARSAEFKTGRSPINVVLESQQRFVGARVDYCQALTEYNKATSYVEYLRGTLLSTNKIVLASRE